MTIYVVRTGDNLSSIAERYGTTVQALVRENGILNVDLISVGQDLRIPQRQDGQIEGQNGQIEGVSLKQLRGRVHRHTTTTRDNARAYNAPCYARSCHSCSA